MIGKITLKLPVQKIGPTSVGSMTDQERQNVETKFAGESRKLQEFPGLDLPGWSGQADTNEAGFWHA